MKAKTTMQDTVRNHEGFGDIALSVQASETHYCQPRKNGLPLENYTSVEVALFNTNGKFIRPSRIGIKGFNRYFDRTGNTPVARYVPMGVVNQLRMALAKKFGNQ